MNIEATNIRVSGTVAEFRRIADALAITDPDTSAFIHGRFRVYDPMSTGEEAPRYHGDEIEIRIDFRESEATRSVIKAIDTLHLVPADA